MNNFLKRGKKINKSDISNNIEIHINSICIAKLFESLGVYDNDIEDKNYVKCVPSIVFNASNIAKKKFIEGLIDADGHLANKDMIHITNTSKKLINGVMILINSLGSVSNLHKKQPTIGGNINGRIINGKKESYQLYFNNRLCNDIYDNMIENKKNQDNENLVNTDTTNYNIRSNEQKII
mgnify:FL=1